MPWFDPQEQNAAWEAPQSNGPVAQTAPNGLTIPNTIAAGGTYVSGLLLSDGFKALAVGCNSSQGGAIGVTRFIDLAGLVPLGSNASATLTAAAAGAVTVTDGLPFASFKITITNTGVSTATVTNFAVLMNAV